MNSRVGEKNTFYGKTHNEESKKIMSESSKKRTKYIFECTSSDGVVYKNVIHLQDFMNEHDLGRQNNIKFGKEVNEKKHKGWLIKRTLEKGNK